MRSLFKIVLLVIVVLPAFTQAQGISQLQVWTSTSSPYSALTVSSHARNIYAPYSNATTSSIAASVFCLSTDCRSVWPSSGGSFPFTPTVDGNATSTTLIFGAGFLSQASSTFTGNATTTGMHSVGSLWINSERFTDLTGTGLTITGNALTLDASGDWTGTFDGQQGTYYLARANHTGTQLSTTISDFTTAAQSALSGLYEVPLTFTSPLRRTSNTIDWTGLSTTTQPSSSNLLVSNGAAGVYGVATSTLTATSPLTGTFTQVGSGGSLGCQTASGAQAGCLSSTDWTTFNSKESVLTFTYPLVRTSNTITTAFGTTTANTFSQTNIFSGILQAARVIISGIAAAFTPSSEGEIGIDSSDGTQLKYYAGGSVRTLSPVIFRSFGYATSSFTGTTTLPLGPAGSSETWQYLKCFTDTGTVQVSVYDGTNRMNFISASTTVGTTTLTTNNSFVSSETRYVDLGTPASSPTKVGCTAAITIDPT